MCSPAEIEMLEMMRQEEEMLKTENNSISSTEQAVRDIERLREYCIKGGSSPIDTNDPVTLIINSYNLLLLRVKDFERNRFDLNFYQQRASETAIYPGKGTALGLIYCALKLSGEAGEVADNVGKALRDDELYQMGQHDEIATFYDLISERKAKIKLELGDVLWYVSQAAKELGFTLEEIAQANLDKLAARKHKGTLKGSGDDR
jgi:NTP pyrophosphatase (non-canonical NTP hydrolase)